MAALRNKAHGQANLRTGDSREGHVEHRMKAKPGLENLAYQATCVTVAVATRAVPVMTTSVTVKAVGLALCPCVVASVLAGDEPVVFFECR